MSLFGSMMGDVEDDPFFGSHMRHMRQMNNIMSSMFTHPFGMPGGLGSLTYASSRHGGALTPFTPLMPSIQRILSGENLNEHSNLDGGHMSSASSFSSSTVYMSSGPNGNPQVYSSSSSTKIGPNGVKETRKTLQDSRTGTKKMSIGHHIGERAHVIEREQNVYSGDAEERQDFINLDEDEAEDFDREFQQAAGVLRERPALGARRSPPAPRLALPAPPAPPAPRLMLPAPPHARHVLTAQSPAPLAPNVSEEPRRRGARRPLRAGATPLATRSTDVREVYGGSHPQHPQRRHKHGRHSHSRHHDY